MRNAKYLFFWIVILVGCATAALSKQGYAFHRGKRRTTIEELRGGSDEKSDANEKPEHVNVNVFTATGSRRLDQKCSFKVIYEELALDGVKDQIEKYFPGSPPASVQRIFYGTEFISNNEALQEYIREDEYPR